MRVQYLGSQMISGHAVILLRHAKHPRELGKTLPIGPKMCCDVLSNWLIVCYGGHDFDC